MRSERRRARRNSGEARARGGTRAVRNFEPDAEIRRRLEALGADSQVSKVERAIRAERRAARRGIGYDASRHLLLTRLARRLRRRGA